MRPGRNLSHATAPVLRRSLPTSTGTPASRVARRSGAGRAQNPPASPPSARRTAPATRPRLRPSITSSKYSDTGRQIRDRVGVADGGASVSFDQADGALRQVGAGRGVLFDQI